MSSRDVGRESGDRHVSEKVTARRGIIVLLVLAALLPAIVAYGILYRQALSVPYQDDYEAILAFATAYKQLPTLKQKALEIAAEQHNEYKLVFEHSIVAAELEFTHHLNFAFLIALGDLLLLPIGYLSGERIRMLRLVQQAACFNSCPSAFSSSRSPIGRISIGR